MAPILGLLLFCAQASTLALGHDLRISTGVWFLLLTVLCLRHRHASWAPTLFFPAAVLFALWFAAAARAVTLPFGLALLFAYLLDPLVDRLEGRLGRSRAIALLALPTFALATVFALWLVPALVGELSRLLHRLPELRQPLGELARAVSERLGSWGVSIDREAWADLLLPRLEDFGRSLLDASMGVWHGLQGLLGLVSFVVITPVVGFYLLRDIDRLRQGFLEALAPGQREGVRDFLASFDRAVSGYLRGQLLVGVVVGALFALGLTLLGIDYALLVGLAAVFLNLVPYVGSVLTATLALTVALLSDPNWTSVLEVGLLYGAVQLLDGAVLSPRIMGKSLELHPAFVMLAVMIAGQFFGIAGVVVGVPAAALAREGLRRWTPRVLGLLPAGSVNESEEDSP